MIEFKNISVSFPYKNKVINAVKNVSFEIKQGEIFGIVGTSGAGKSTLLRTINLLQKPTEGSLFLNGKDITQLKGEKLRQLRLQTGMIFQQFNLIRTKTVFDNVAFALESAGKKSREEIEKRVHEVLELVGLSDRESAYPSTLSGGQKQRVGIARAIANNPQLLLCDEPTSALDLETTDSILKLLKEINQKFSITTVIISHEMDVIKNICDRVAVMNSGEVLEINCVFDVFTSPQHEFTKTLVNYSINLDLPERILSDKSKDILKIIYSGEKAEKSLITDTVKAFEVNLNILHGKIEYITDKPFGILLVQISGSPQEVEKAKQYLRERVYKMEEQIQ
jgi:D-methionine transport system ATP-binding protein